MVLFFSLSVCLSAMNRVLDVHDLLDTSPAIIDIDLTNGSRSGIAKEKLIINSDGSKSHQEF